MAGQALHLGGGRWVEIDATWRDAGRPPSYAMFGGTKTLVESGAAPKPTIYQKGKEFYYDNMEPVTDVTHVDWFPEPTRSVAIAFVEANQAKPKKTLKVAKKKPGRPPKHTVLEVKDPSTYERVLGANE